MEKFIKEYERVMQENTELKVKLLLKELFNYQELQYEELSYHDFTIKDLIRIKVLLRYHMHEIKNKDHNRSDWNILINKVNNILNSKYGEKEQ